MCQLKHFHCALVDVCQYTLNTSINRETRQTLEHHQIHTLAQALPPYLSKSAEDSSILCQPAQIRAVSGQMG